MRVGIAVVAVAWGLGAACNKPVRLVVDAPVHGTFTTAATVAVSGTAPNANPASAVLTVNGAPVTINPDSTWSTDVAIDSNVVYNPILVELDSGARVLRERVVVIAGDSVADGAYSDESVALRLNDEGLDSVEPLVSSFVDFDLASLLSPGTLLLPSQCVIDGGFLGCLGSASVTAASPAPSFGTFALNVDSFAGFVAGDVVVNDVEVNARVNGSGLAPSCDIRLSAAVTTILGDYALGPDGVDPTLIDVNLQGSPGIVFQGFQDEFTSGLCDFPLIGDIIQAIIGDIEPLVTNGLVGFLADPDGGGPQDAPIAEGIETALSEISIAGPIGDALGVLLEAPIFQVAEDVAGLTLGNDARFVTQIGPGVGECQPPAGAPDLLASLATNASFPSYAQCAGGSNPGAACTSNGQCAGGGSCLARTPGGLPYGLGLGISNEAFNQLLRSQTECGLLVTSISELDLGFGPIALTAGLLAAFVPEFSVFDPAAPFRIDLRPTLSPVVTDDPGPAGELATLELGQLVAELFLDDGSETLVLSLAADATLGFDVTFDDVLGELAFNLATPDVDDLRLAVVVNSIGADATSLETNVLPPILTLLLPDLASSLGAFPLPQFLGLNLQGVDVARQGEFMSLFADLVVP